MLTQRAASRLEAEVGEARPYAPEIVDVEVMSALRRRARQGRLPEAVAKRLVIAQSRSTIRRVRHALLLPAAWELRHNVTASDALYVALAQAFGARLITSDARLAGAPGLGIAVTVLPTG
jgi:predicted nucleic acid-binding protein